MKTSSKRFAQRQTVLALSLLAAFSAVYAQDAEDEDPEITAMKTPGSVVSVGVAGVNGSNQDKSLYGQYNGRRDNSASVQLDLDIKKRDTATGTWTLIKGNNLGLDNRDLSGAYIKQGDWKLTADYNAITHNDPRTLNTAAGDALNLSTKREGIGLGGAKWITPRLQFELDFKNEDKTGARLSGRGIACGVYSSAYNVCGAAAGTAALLASTTGGLLFAAEPVNSSIKQIDARLNYAGESLKLHGGYYGSFYTNGTASYVPAMGATLRNPDGSAALGTLAGLLQTPVALAPDNQAHQIYVDGVYTFTPTTRANFKLAKTHATQTADFAAMGFTGPAGVGNLGGVVDTTLSQLGLTARPTAKLSVLGNIRYEDKQDSTPLALYNVTGPNLAGFVSSYTNNPHSSKKLNSKLEANYQINDNYRATLGLDYAEVHRDRPVSTTLIDGLTALREDTRETTYRAEVSRAMSETANGRVSYSHSERSGTSWLGLGAGFPAVSDALIYNANGAFPYTLEDRQRDKVRLSADWTVSDDVSVQFMLEDGKDSYSAPTAVGLRDTGMRSYGVDASWQLSSKWKLNGYWNLGQQTLHVNHAGYLAELNNTSNSLSIGLVGSPVSNYEVGLNLSYLKDNNQYQQSLASGLPLVYAGLPDDNYRVTSLKFYTKRALDKSASVRLDLVHQRATLDDWTWNGFSASDGATVAMQPNQNVTFVGVTYVYLLK